MTDAAAARALSQQERDFVERARVKAHTLYEGKVVAHRSCGIALAETFNLGTAPYQVLRRGGITGRGSCGAIRAGELILGQLLGDPDPTGPVTDSLRAAVTWYQSEVPKRINRGQSANYICNNLTAPHGDFGGDARKRFCTSIAAAVAELTAEALVLFAPELSIDITAVEGASES